MRAQSSLRRALGKAVLVTAGTVLLVPTTQFVAAVAERRGSGLMPPSKTERLRAIGSLQGLTPALKRALDPGSDFKPIPKPGPADWLAQHPEPGQTFDQFVRGKPNRPDRRRNTIYFLPIGQFDPKTSPPLEHLKACAEAYFQLKVKVLPAADLDGLKLTSRRHPTTRIKQYLTGDILRLLARKLPDDAYCLLGITMQDLYPEDSWNFVFGQASLAGRVGVYSFARYDPAFYGDPATGDDRRLILRRSSKVLVHETAHMFGLQHCIYYTCVVNGSNHLGESDSRPMRLCPVCLHKLQWNVGFDVVKRYRNLKEVYDRIGLKDEARWIEARLKRIADRENGDGNTP